MNRRLPMATVLLCLMSFYAGAESTPEHWEVVKYVGASSLSSSPESLQKFVGTKCLMSEKKIDLGGKICAVESVHTLSTAGQARRCFLKEFKADYDKLGAAAPISVIATECNTVIRSLSARERVIVEWNGDFF